MQVNGKMKTQIFHNEIISEIIEGYLRKLKKKLFVGIFFV